MQDRMAGHEAGHEEGVVEQHGPQNSGRNAMMQSREPGPARVGNHQSNSGTDGSRWSDGRNCRVQIRIVANLADEGEK